MKIFFKTFSIIVTLFLLHQNANAQLTILQNGTVNGTPANKFLNKTDTITFSAAEKSLLRKTLMQQVQKALDNIQDDALPLKKLYSILWTDNATIEKELKTLLTYLHTGKVPPGRFSYIPNPQDLEDKVFNAPIYEITPLNTGFEYDSRTLVYREPLKRFLIKYFNDAKVADGIDNYMMNSAYKSGWRQLEQMLARGEKIHKQMNDSLDECKAPVCSLLDRYNSLADSLNSIITGSYLHDKLGNQTGVKVDNYVVGLLKKDFYKKWLWYTEGYLLINPLGATTIDRRYPENEKISQLKDEDKKTLLSAEDERLKLDELQMVNKYKNELLFARTDNKSQQVFYDAATRQTGNKYKRLNDLPSIKSDDKIIKAVVYNVPRGVSLSVEMNAKDLKDESAATSAIDDALGNAGLATIIGGVSDWLNKYNNVNDSFKSFQNLPQMPELKLASLPHDAVKSSLDPKSNKIGAANSFSTIMSNHHLFSQMTIEKEKQPLPPEMQALKKIYEKVSIEDVFVEIKGIVYKASKVVDTDKKVFIKASMIEKVSKDKCYSCSTQIKDCIIDQFLVTDYCYSINYNNISFKNEVEKLLTRFQCFIKTVNNCKNKLETFSTKLTSNLNELKSLLSIIQRSLPPVSLGEKTNKQSDYRTVVLSPEDIEPPKKVTLTIKSTQKEDIRFEGREVSKPTDTSTPSLIVVADNFKLVKRHYLDFSVGLACQTKDYVQTTNDGNTITSENAPRLKVIAGMHFYPLGLVKVNDKLLRDWRTFGERFSLFFGLGLSKTLENLYPGISYDLVPGIRVIGGYHYFKNNRYTVQRGSIISKESAYQGSNVFLSFNLEPGTFAKLIGLIN